MAEETTEPIEAAEQREQAHDGSAAPPDRQPEPQGETAETVDWKAEARKWEARAKENKGKADAAEGLARETRDELERSRLVMRISRETGVPADLIHGATEEELAASARAASEWAASMAPRYPSDKGGSATAAPVTRESIERIKDPLARVSARAEHANLYR